MRRIAVVVIVVAIAGNVGADEIALLALTGIIGAVAGSAVVRALRAPTAAGRQVMDGLEGLPMSLCTAETPRPAQRHLP